jgi:hypothetical protein
MNAAKGERPARRHSTRAPAGPGASQRTRVRQLPFGRGSSHRVSSRSGTRPPCLTVSTHQGVSALVAGLRAVTAHNIGVPGKLQVSKHEFGRFRRPSDTSRSSLDLRICR